MKEKLTLEEEFLYRFIVYKISGISNSTNFYKRKDINWNKIYDLSVRHKLYYFIYQEYKNYMPKKICEKFKMLLAKKKHTTDLLWEEVLTILNTAKKQNIDVYLLRGIVFSELFYSDLYARNGSDVDLLVRENEYSKMEELLQSLNYRKEFYYNEELTKLDRYHQTEVIFGKYRDDNNIWVELLTEKNFIPSHKLNTWMDHGKRMVIKNQEVLQFPIEYQCLLLFSNVYVNSEYIYSNLENRISLRDYLDIGSFCSKYANQLDWHALSLLADKSGIANQVYCVMQNMNQLVSEFFAFSVMKFFNSQHTQHPESANNENGAIIDWDMPFVERMFKDKIRKEQCLLTLKKMIDSEKNIHFHQPETIHPKEELLNNKWKTFSSIRNNFNIDYQFYFDNNNFYIKLCLNKINLEKYYLRFGFIHTLENTKLSDLFDLDIIIHLKKDASLLVNSMKNNYKITYVTEDEVEITIPFDCFGIPFPPPAKKIYYNIILIEEISENVYKNVGFEFNYALTNRINYPCIKLST